MTILFSKHFKLFFSTLLISFFLIPLLAFTQGNVPPSGTLPPGGGNTGITYECFGPDASGTKVYGNCTFDDLILATQKVVKYGVTLAISISVLVIAWAGFNYMISVDNTNKKKEANTMLWKGVKGMAYIMAAWLIVTLITNALLTDAVRQAIPLR